VILLLDLGSTAVRVSLARIMPGVAFHVAREESIQTGLPNGRRNALSASALRGTLDAVRAFLQDLRAEGDVPGLVVATAALRDANGGAALLETLKREQALEVRVLSGSEEARLGAIAARGSLSDRQALIADLGGTSFHLSCLQEREIRPVARVSLGAVEAAHRFLKHDPPTLAELRALRRETRQQVADVLPALGERAGVVGLGGHAQALGRLHLRTIRDRRTCLHALCLQLTDVAGLRERLETLLSPQRGKVNGLAVQRARILLATAVVFEHVIALGGYPTLTICARGVEYGILIVETFGEAPRE
jgi:exopolyphosphatase/guanosine-5'-triphosphate,3'-diphosphate pyrophosphatase